MLQVVFEAVASGRAAGVITQVSGVAEGGLAALGPFAAGTGRRYGAAGCGRCAHT